MCVRSLRDARPFKLVLLILVDPSYPPSCVGGVHHQKRRN